MSANLFKQAFSSDLQKNLFPANAFYKRSKDDSAFVTGKQVNLPHSGAKPSVVTDRSSFPATISQRTDTPSAYTISEHSSDPTHIQYSEELIVTYAKRASIVEEHASALIEKIAENMGYVWARGGDSENAWATKPEIVRTSSASVRATALPSGTGNRKRVALADLLKAQTILNRQDVPMGGRVALITADMLEDLMLIDEFSSSDYNKFKPIADGSSESFTWLGMNWYIRSKVNTFDNTATPVLKAVGAAGAATDNAGALIWHPNFVRRAEGGIVTFADFGKPEYFGDVVSALVRSGGIGARKDAKGIVNLVEAAGA